MLVFTRNSQKIKKSFYCIMTIINDDILLKMQRCWMAIECSHHENNNDVC